MQAAIDAFLANLGVVRRLSPRTIAAYRDDLARLAAFAATQGVERETALRDDHVRGFVAAESRRGVGGKSLQRRLSACRSFFRWLQREGRLAHNPAAGVRAPKAPRRLPQVLDADEVGALIDAPGEGALGTRDRAMLELFYSSALRLSELCALRWRDLDLAQGLVRVTGKGAKTRDVPVGGHAAEALEAWRREGGGTGDAPVFTGRGGRPIAPRTVQARLAHWAKRQGTWKRVHPHVLRHSCASHVLESSGNLRAVQEMLGHADIATTQVYTHLDFQHLSKVYDAAHPRARRKSKA
ncbi:MAG TPA: tyrosine recombinase XerC [Xanthomonadales bacterium]|nr:tyrosine recombinase XerC [Xanthomonadales bacterium]